MHATLLHHHKLYDNLCVLAWPKRGHFAAEGKGQDAPLPILCTEAKCGLNLTSKLVDGRVSFTTPGSSRLGSLHSFAHRQKGLVWRLRRNREEEGLLPLSICLLRRSPHSV